jgi:DNA repair exonuclease SbcCD ATPase subunit
MNHYLLLMGPALGFILGMFFAWFLTYSRLKQVEREALEEKNLLSEQVEQGKEAEIEGRCALEERIKRIEELEKKLEELKGFEQEVATLREQNQNLLEQCSEKKSAAADLENDLKEARQDIKEALHRAETMHEKLKELAVVRERTRKLEEENSKLLKENEQLRNMEVQLRQINEIKEMYSRTVEENQSFKNQDMVRHFMEIKDGLQQSIKAYNRMLKLVDNPMLDDETTIEIEAAEGDLTEEQMLDHVAPDTDELEKLDGVN